MSEPIYVYDLSEKHKQTDLRNKESVRFLWDECHLASSLQGLVNRDQARLYLRLNPCVDDFWLEQMTDQGAWMEDRQVEFLRGGIEELLGRFGEAFEGFVVYDERIPATSNLASTIAGAEKRLCLRFDETSGSLYTRLKDAGRLENAVYLMAEDGGPLFTGQGSIPGTDVPSTVSPKNDAYLWLVERYLKTGKTNPRTMGYYIDAFWIQCAFADWPVNHTLTNHDYIIAKGGFFFDLNVWENEAPVDEPGQKPGTDVETLKKILYAANDQLGGKELIHVAGYVPWAYKYTNCHKEGWSAGSQYDAVPAEWKCTEILTSFNAYLDADALSYASMANASFFMHFPLPDRIPQNPPPSEEELRERGILDSEGKIVPRNYYAHYVGDYDAAAWLYWNLPVFWRDPDRGKIPLTWAFNPNLCQRFGYGMKWARDSRTENDHFVAGDSGAGYVNPRNLSEPRRHSGLPGAMHLWEEHSRRYMEQWDLSIVGFVLDGNCPNMTEEGWKAFTKIAPGGLVFHRLPADPGLYEGVPYMEYHGDLPREEASKAAAIAVSKFSPETPNFLCFRSVLMPPSWYVELEREISQRDRGDAMLIDMRTLLYLLKKQLESG